MSPNSNPLQTSFEGDSCIIKQDIYRAIIFLDIFYELVDALLIAHIQLHHLYSVFVFRSQHFLPGLFRQLNIPTRHYYLVRFTS